MKLTKELAAAELARRSLTDFVRVVRPDLSTTAFHRRYYRTLDAFAGGKIRRLIVSIPPQHGKSSGSSVLLPAYLLGIRPETKIALASYNLQLASRFNRQIQQTIDSEAYAAVFPDTRLARPGARDRHTIRTHEAFELVGKAGGLLSVGRDGTLTGNPVDVFILDDLYKNAMEAHSPLVRDNVWAWYNSVVRTRLHNRSQELIVFTRWHEDDLIGRIARHERIVPLEEDPPETPPDEETWYSLNFEAIKRSPPTRLDPRLPGEALWPERHSPALLDRKRRFDPLMFEAMYQGCPSSREGLLYGDRFQTYETLPDGLVKRGNYTDTADCGEDCLCSICYATDREGIVYVTDVLYTPQSMEATEPAVADMLLRNGTLQARIESNNGGRGFARAVKRLAPGVRIEWFHQSANKESRILTYAPAVLERIRMPPAWNLRWPAFHDDLVTFRRVFRSNRRDDAADALTGIAETEEANTDAKNIRAYGFRN